MEKENHGDFAKKMLPQPPHWNSPETDIRRFHQCIFRNPSGNSRPHPLPQETHFDETLEAAFADLSILPRSDHRALSSVINDGDVCFGWGVINRIDVSGLSGRGLQPRPAKEWRPGNVEFQRPLTSQNGDIGNVVNTAPQGYWNMGFDIEGGSVPYQSPETIEQRSNSGGVFPDDRRWGAGQREVKGELPVASLSHRIGLLSGFFEGNHCLTDGYGYSNTTRSSAMNSRRPNWLREPLNYLRVEDIRGRIVSLAKDQHGCRFLQEKIDGATVREIDIIFLEVIEHIGELMVDPFGNYVVQKLVEVCREEQRTQILLTVTLRDYELVSLCLNMHGSRAVQKLLDHMTTQEQISIVISAITPGTVALTKDSNGHHVFQHCLRHFSDEDNKYLLNEVIHNCYGIATDKSGCCVLQQCIDYSHGELRERLIAEISAHSLQLSKDPYGNYVIQHLLEMRNPHVTSNILRQLQGNHICLSRDKYASNVVQKCVVETGEEESTRVTMELLSSPDVSMLLLHPYGNYVFQSALKVSKGLLYGALRDLVRKNYAMMRNNVYGKRVLEWFEKRKLRVF